MILKRPVARPFTPAAAWLPVDLAALGSVLFILSLAQMLVLPAVTPTIIRGDGVGYYAYLRSAFFDRDLDFTNEYRHYAGVLPADSQPVTTGFLTGKRPASGLPHNPWGVGTALLWAPFFLAGHLAASAAAWLGLPVAPDGYSIPYQLAVAVGSATYAFAGLLLVGKIIRGQFSAPARVLALLLIWLGTSLTAYAYFIPSMSHAISFFCAAAFIYAWYRPLRGPGSHPGLAYPARPRPLASWAALGALGGLLLLQRLQNAVFLVLIMIELALLAREHLRGVRVAHWRQQAAGLLAFGLSALVVFSPQLFVWRHLYGQFLPAAHFDSTGLTFDWLNPHLIEVLLSPNHGLLTWTPLVLFSLAGVILLCWRENNTRLLALGLTAAFLLQLYMVSVWPGWHQGASFGGRMFVSSSALFVLGLAAFIDWLGERVPYRWLAVIGGLFVTWNYLLLFQYGTGMISRYSAFSWGQLAGNTLAIAQTLASATVYFLP